MLPVLQTNFAHVQVAKPSDYSNRPQLLRRQLKQNPHRLKTVIAERILAQRKQTATPSNIPTPEGWNVISGWTLANVDEARACQLTNENVSIWHCVATTAEQRAVLGTPRAAVVDKPIQIAVSLDGSTYFRYLESRIRTNDSPESSLEGRSCQNNSTQTMAILPSYLAQQHNVPPVLNLNLLPAGLTKPNIPTAVPAGTITTTVANRGPAHQAMGLPLNVFLHIMNSGQELAGQFPNYNGLSGLSLTCNNGARAVFSSGIQRANGQVIMRVSQ